MSREFSRRVSTQRQQSGAGAPPSRDPAPIVGLYNAVVGHIADQVSSEELSKISWPPAEFCLPDNGAFVPRLGWNTGPHLAWLRETVLNLRLPQLKQLSSSGQCDLHPSFFIRVR